MMSRFGMAFGFATLLALATPTLAQTAASAEEATAKATEAAGKAKQKVEDAAAKATALKQKAAAKNATEIVLVNGRQVDVTGVSVTGADGKAVASLKKPLAAGKKASLKLGKKAGCVFAVTATFADDAEFDQSEMDLCADKTVRFTD